MVAKRAVDEEKKKAAQLHRMFYGDDKVEEYLAELDGKTRGHGPRLSLGPFKVSQNKVKKRGLC